MQFLLDTATDSPSELRAAARMILSITDDKALLSVDGDKTAPDFAPADSLPADKFETPSPTFTGTITLPPAPPAPPPPPSRYPDVEAATGRPIYSDVVSDDDPEVTIDDAGNVTAVTVSTELPAAPPPPAAVPLPPGPAVAPELDSRGMPYDARIHAGNRAKKLDGSWKNRRGVDTSLVTACEAQNKPGNAPSGAAPMTTAIASSDTVTSVASVSAVATPAASSPPPPSPTVGTAAPAAVVPSAIDFRGLMQKIQAQTAAGKLTTEQVNNALAGVGLRAEEMAQLINNAPLIASVNAAIDKVVA